MSVVPVALKHSTKPFCRLLKAGAWMMAEGVTGRVGAEDAAGEEDSVVGCGDAGDGEATAACVGDEDWIQVLIELADEGVCGGAGRVGKCCAGGCGDAAGGCGAGDVDVAGGIEGHGQADVACGAELRLREDVCRGGVCLEEADAVFLIEEEVEVAGGVGLDGVELGVKLCGIGRAEEAGKDELLRAGVLCGKKRGGEG